MGLIFAGLLVVTLVVQELEQQRNASVDVFQIVIKEERVLRPVIPLRNFLLRVPSSVNVVEEAGLVVSTVLAHPLGVESHRLHTQ